MLLRKLIFGRIGVSRRPPFCWLSVSWRVAPTLFLLATKRSRACFRKQMNAEQRADTAHRELIWRSFGAASLLGWRSLA